MLRLDDRWIWDFWLTRDGPDHHVFFLQAPRALGDPELRHANASIGHAVSTDLTTWAVLPDALSRDAPGSWDDRALWTGSVVRYDGTWYLFYTGTSNGDGGLVQRIGAAVSDDLVNWRRHRANPLIGPERRWYERSDHTAWLDEAWRDPWVFRPPGGDEHVALITARARTGPPDGRGAIAVARSADLVRWDVGPPVFAPGEFGELEVPQVVPLAGRWYLLFSVPDRAHGRRWRDRTGQVPRSTVYYVAGDGPTGPFVGPARPVLSGDGADELYAGKLVEDGAGAWWFLAARFARSGGAFIGELTDPVPVAVGPDRNLVVNAWAPASSAGGGGTATNAGVR